MEGANVISQPRNSGRGAGQKKMMLSRLMGKLLTLLPGGLPPKPTASISSPSPSGTGNSTMPDQPAGTRGSTFSSQPSIPGTGFDVVEPDEDKPNRMQEFYPPSSLSYFSQSTWSPTDEAMINRLDGILEQGSVDERKRARVLNNLRKSCYRDQSIPAPVKIQHVNNNSHMDGWIRERVRMASQGLPGGCQVLQPYAANCKVVLKGFCKEVAIWRHLRHPNIPPLVGATISLKRRSVDSDWMENGMVNKFIETNPLANRVDLFFDVVKVLVYMHESSVVHGDLRGENILVDEHCRTRLMDFDLPTTIGANLYLDYLDSNLPSVGQRDSLMSMDRVMERQGGEWFWRTFAKFAP